MGLFLAVKPLIGSGLYSDQNQPSFEPDDSLIITVQDVNALRSWASVLSSHRAAGAWYCSLTMTAPSGMGPVLPFDSHALTSGE